MVGADGVVGWARAPAAAVWGAVFCERAAAALGAGWPSPPLVLAAAAVAAVAALRLIRPPLPAAMPGPRPTP